MDTKEQCIYLVNIFSQEAIHILSCSQPPPLSGTHETRIVIFSWRTHRDHQFGSQRKSGLHQKGVTSECLLFPMQGRSSTHFSVLEDLGVNLKDTVSVILNHESFATNLCVNAVARFTAYDKNIDSQATSSAIGISKCIKTLQDGEKTAVCWVRPFAHLGSL